MSEIRQYEIESATNYFEHRLKQQLFYGERPSIHTALAALREKAEHLNRRGPPEEGQ